MSPDIGDTGESAMSSYARMPVCHHRRGGREPTVPEVVADYGVSKSWVYELLARYRGEGDAAFQPRSRRPQTSPTAAPPRSST